MTMTLEQLRAMETRLVIALGDTTRAVFYDDFKRENRPISEVTAALDRVRAEIAAHPDNVQAKRHQRFVPVRLRSAY